MTFSARLRAGRDDGHLRAQRQTDERGKETAMKKWDERDDLWPLTLEFTCVLAMPLFFWLGWLARGYAP